MVVVVDMDSKTKVKNLFSYLLSIKKMDEGVITNLNQYEKLFWQVNLQAAYKSCIKNDVTKEEWFQIDKTNKQLYDEFFKLYLSLQKNSESLEVVWGNYVLAWNIENKRIINPIFTTKMELCFDAEKGYFSLKPYDGKTKMELDMFVGIDIPNIGEILKVKKEAENNTFDPRNINEVENILYKTAHYLSSDINPNGEIQKEVCGLSDIKVTKYPVFFNAPVIIVRKIDNRLWNSELNNILKAIDNGYPIPPTVQALVEDDVFESDKEKAEWEKIGKNLLFPLPSNEEQREVVKRISENYGVVVQGPPGTGKSHTIVNLICHLLAHGKRVLVTSQTGRALRVLSERIPEEIKPLCISILGDDTKSLKELDEAVRIITENLSVNPETLKQEIIPLKRQLQYCLKRQKDLHDMLKDAEAIENTNLNYNGMLGKLMDMAKWVKENEKEYSWLEDNIKTSDKSPITDEELLHLINLLNSIDELDVKKVSRISKVLDELPECQEAISKIETINKLESKYDEFMDSLKNWVIPKSLNLNYKELIELLNTAEEQIVKIDGTWLKNVMNYYYNSEVIRPIIKHLYMKTDMLVKDLSDLERRLTVHKIQLPDNLDFNKFKKDFKNVYETIKLKGKLGKVYKLFHSEYKYIFNTCLLDEKPINSKEQGDVIYLYINKKNLENQLLSLWNSTMADYGALKIESYDINSIVLIEEGIKGLGRIIDWNMDYKSKIIDSLGQITFIKNLDWYDSSTYSNLKKGVLSIKYITEYKAARAMITNLSRLCESTRGIETLGTAFKNLDTEKVIEEYKEVIRLKKLEKGVKEINVYVDKLEKVVPAFTFKLLKSEDKMKFKDFNLAFKWKQMSTILHKAHNIKPELIENLFEQEREKEKILIKKIVAGQAWYNQIIHTSDVQKRSLYAWMQAVKRIGRGTGKFADKYRNMAQKEMEQCKDSIPVWIMPLNKVIENIKLTSSIFDVIIFDESSQSDIFALCALFRAKRAVIVGDDKQISPQVIGVDQDRINELIDRYLKEIPHSEWFDLETSLYNTALRVFPDRLLLKEHFRCVPEIIGFSNELCYSGEIVPLRRPEKSEVFENPIVTVKVENAEKDKIKNINAVEAQALVKQVVACCRDQKYRDMSMGVISLLGDGQAEIIENMLREKLGEKEMIKRKLICGDAYSFQGDERDIIFLSMVVADNVKFAPLTREADIRRFNVAVSRARDQLWLFYSFNTEKLNTECVRTKLYRYCTDPAIVKNNDKHNNIFVNDFQKDVFQFINKSGYKIRPFIKLGRHEVDFIIEGNNKKIAIECDGGNWTGTQNWELNHERQMTLERVGWTFYKIRGSEFYRNPEKTMEGLWLKLKDLGIEKVTA